LIVFSLTAFIVQGQSAEQVTVEVDSSTVLHTISPYAFGANYGPYSSTPVDLLDEVQNAGINLLRFPGGDVEYRPQQIDFAVRAANLAGAELTITVHKPDRTPEDAAEIVRYVNIEKEYNVRYWSIGNEPNRYSEHFDPDYDVERFNEDWRVFAEAMLQVDPDILFIGPDVSQYSTDPSSSAYVGYEWVRSFLEANGDMLSVITVHRYPFPQSQLELATVDEMRENVLEFTDMLDSLRELSEEVLGYELPVAMTEINSYWSSSQGGETTPDSHFNAIWWADVFGRLLKQDPWGVLYFDLQSNIARGGWGLMATYEVRPTYYVYQLYQQFGEEMLAATSDHEFVSAYAAQRNDGAITLILVNLDDVEHDIALYVDADEFTGDAELQLYMVDGLSESVTWDSSEGLSLPAQSITLLVMP